MNPELKKYLAEIGGRGGSATTEKKASAVRKNGALGGRHEKTVAHQAQGHWRM